MIKCVICNKQIKGKGKRLWICKQCREPTCHSCRSGNYCKDCHPSNSESSLSKEYFKEKYSNKTVGIGMFVLLMLFFVLLASTVNGLSISNHEYSQSPSTLTYCMDVTLERTYLRSDFTPYHNQSEQACEGLKLDLYKMVYRTSSQTLTVIDPDCTQKPSLSANGTSFLTTCKDTVSFPSFTQGSMVMETFTSLPAGKHRVCVKAAKKANVGRCDINLKISDYEGGLYHTEKDGFAWWNSSWNKRANFTVKKDVNLTSCEDFPVEVHLNGSISNFSYFDFQSDGSDMRWLNGTEDGELDFVLCEEGCWNTSGTSVVYVNVSVCPGVDTDIHMYFNSTENSIVSSFNDTFSPNVLVYYPMDYGNGSDISDNKYHAVGVGSTNPVSNESCNKGSGQFATQVGCYHFPGDDTYLETPSITGNHHTIMFWVKDTIDQGSPNYFMGVVGNNPPLIGSGGFSSGMTNEALWIMSPQGFNVKFNYIKDITSEGWHHSIFTYNSSRNDYDIYLNGSSPAMFDVGIPLVIASTPWFLGNGAVGGVNNMSGLYDDLVIYNIGLQNGLNDNILRLWSHKPQVVFGGVDELVAPVIPPVVTDTCNLSVSVPCRGCRYQDNHLTVAYSCLNNTNFTASDCEYHINNFASVFPLNCSVFNITAELGWNVFNLSVENSTGHVVSAQFSFWAKQQGSQSLAEYIVILVMSIIIVVTVLVAQKSGYGIAYVFAGLGLLILGIHFLAFSYYFGIFMIVMSIPVMFMWVFKN